jgi:hypothetical protein
MMIGLTIALLPLFPAAAEPGAAPGEKVSLADPSVFPPQRVRDDTGINVLLDIAHQMLFFTSWDLPPALRRQGLRVVGSQASLDSVLPAGSRARVRIPKDGELPFGWIAAPSFDVVLTIQPDPDAQPYLPEEIAALKSFVEAGGGLVMVGGGAEGEGRAGRWPLNALGAAFGVRFGGPAADVEGRKCATLRLDGPWTIDLAASGGGPVVAHRTFGSGRAAAVGDFGLIRWDGKTPEGPRSRDAVAAFLAGTIRRACEGKRPTGGEPRLPVEAAGGGPIYPEREFAVGDDFLVLAARNQKADLLRAVTEEMPKVRDGVLAWFPSSRGGKKTWLILAAGGGGGWAVNAYKPEEVGIISLDAEGVLSVFAHELTHNLPGPPNDGGRQAGRLPGVFSEAHAGWFQGKIEALRTGKRDGHDPNGLFRFDRDGSGLDLAKLDPKDSSKGWTKLWYIWQRLDERFGPTWYPRWMWVKNVRWAAEPDRALSWDDVVEDMSIACGEDLFPFFRKLGTSLGKERFPEAGFQGKKMALPEARIPMERAGDARLGPIGDFKKPLDRKGG